MSYHPAPGIRREIRKTSNSMVCINKFEWFAVNFELEKAVKLGELANLDVMI